MAKTESAYIHMKTIGIIAEFNPFHNGHLHLIEYCRKKLHADYIVVVMSGDFVQRGTPAFVCKFARTKMALSCGADLVLELPVYYSTGSAEFFASGAVALLNKLGCVDQLVFGSECGDIEVLDLIANILVEEPGQFKDVLSEHVKKGDSYPVARQKALLSYITESNLPINEPCEIEGLLSSPNNILGIEYIKALKATNSSIMPVTIKRIGESYNSANINSLASASGIRKYICEEGLKKDSLRDSMPGSCLDLLIENSDRFADMKRYSDLVYYKLLVEKENGYTRYLDVNNDLSNKIVSNLEKYENFDQFCLLLKSKDIAYSRICRCLTHILLNITADNMSEYKSDQFTSYIRVLGMRVYSSALVKRINASCGGKAITNIKNAEKELTELEYQLFKETIMATEIYNSICPQKNPNEYRLKQIII